MFHESHQCNWCVYEHHPSVISPGLCNIDYRSAGCKLPDRWLHHSEVAWDLSVGAVPWQPWGKPHTDLRDNAFSSCRATPCLQNIISSKSTLAFQAGKFCRLKILYKKCFLKQLINLFTLLFVLLEASCRCCSCCFMNGI